ncbi:MAG TPA: hypothetical protein VGS10_00445 [Terracidiphilus sp.]|nr:hypothetical protein [Terracidiphilus sp.]
MKEAKPPSLATWMLEHLTPADRDEALAGDLLEDFQSGRSTGWYWRQAIAACTVGWIRHLGDRKMLVAFAGLWSMLAPAWLALELRIFDGSSASRGTWRMDAQFSGPGAIALWLILNLGFIWAGMLLYFASHANFASAFSKEKVVRALTVAVPIFFFAYFGTFVLANLYSYPGPLVARSTITPLGELTDLRGWADLLRVPYFITLVCALWKTTGLRRIREQEAPETAQALTSPPPHDLTLYAEPEQWSATRFFGFMLAAGLLNATIAAWIVCRLPDDYFPSLASLLLRAVFCVAATALAGVGASRFYWNRAPRPPATTPQVSFATFALASAAGWVWIPPAMFLATQNTPATAIIIAIGAAVLGLGLRKGIPAASDPAPEETGMFAATLRTPRFEATGYVMSACFYLAFLAFADRQNVNAGAPLAVCTFLLAWNLTRAPRTEQSGRGRTRDAATRLSRAAVPAILLTLYALLFGIQVRNEKAARAAAAAAAENSVTANAKHSNGNTLGGGNGLKAWQSVVLWPAPPQKQGIIAPMHSRLLAPGSNQPLIIRFVGPYLYFHAPHTGPGPLAHMARGNPLIQPIVANDFIPLVMEARQNLAAEIPLSRCREIDLTVDYRSEGASISVALLLADSAAPAKHQLLLDQQKLTGPWGSDQAQAVLPGQPGHSILHFDVPAHARIRGFDQILVMFLTDPMHALVGPRIAIEEFKLLPR